MARKAILKDQVKSRLTNMSSGKCARSKSERRDYGAKASLSLGPNVMTSGYFALGAAFVEILIIN